MGIIEAKITVDIFENFVETEAWFCVKPPFDQDIVLPFIPKGTINDMTVMQNGAVFSEARAVNIREFYAKPCKNTVLVSNRMDGRIVLKLNGVLNDGVVEVKIKSVSGSENYKNRMSILFPCGWGDAVLGKIAVKVHGGAVSISSSGKVIKQRKDENLLEAEFEANINGENCVLDIEYVDDRKNSVMVSRRIFGDNIAYCSFFPTIGEGEDSVLARIETIGGLGTRVMNDKIILKHGCKAHCFVKHSIIPPKGIRIIREDNGGTEEIYFGSVSTRLMYMPVELLCAKEMVKILEEKMKNTSPEKKYLVRDEINEIAVKCNAVMGDIALAGFSGNAPAGIIAYCDYTYKENGGYLKEKYEVNTEEVMERILSSQTQDGVIAEPYVYEESMLVLSTAICLIALYLYEGRKYENFAKRSLMFLKNKSGYWKEIALKLWNGEEVDEEELICKADMKIMYQRLDELAVSLIKNYRRKNNDSNRM